MTETTETSEDEGGTVTVQTAPETTFADVDGLNEQKQKLGRTLVDSMVQEYDGYGTNVALLYGPSGTGKSRVATALAGELGTEGFSYVSVETLTAENQPPVELVESVLQTAREHQPCTVVFDCFTELVHNDDAFRAFRREMQRVSAAGDSVAVVCAMTVYERGLALRKESLATFPEVKVHVPTPDEGRRAAILRTELDAAVDRDLISVDDETVDMDTLVAQTEGFNAADLAAVAKRTVQTALGDADAEPPIVVTQGTLLDVVDRIDEESLSSRDRETQDCLDFEATVPDVTFDDIGGLEQAKRELREAVQFPQQFGALYEQTGFSADRGILLYGPPGNGKTMLAKALANATDRTFLSVKGPELETPMFGMSEQQIRSLFESAREKAPSVVFFDEFDSLATDRSSDGAAADVKADMVNTLLAELDGLEPLGDVVVIAATNRPEALDSAVLRPGRLAKHISVGLPEEGSQADIFAIHMADAPTAEDVTPEWFVDVSPATLTGADVAGICEEAFHLALRAASEGDNDTVRITREHLEQAIDNVETVTVVENNDRFDDDHASFY
jgi:SpoVK/Ycf46/Vps4 family AAA+-type ATPase